MGKQLGVSGESVCLAMQIFRYAPKEAEAVKQKQTTQRGGA